MARRRDRDEDYDDDDDFEPRPRRRRDEDKDYDDQPRSRAKPNNGDVTAVVVQVLGGLSLAQGIIALMGSLIPCVGAVAAIGGLIGLILGVIGIVVAKKSNGRPSCGLAIAGTSLSVVAIVIGLIWFAITAIFLQSGGMVKQAAEQAALQEQTEIRTSPAISVTAFALEKEFEDGNADLKADIKYVSKIVEVTGEVVRVSRAQYYISVELKAGEDGETVDCQFRLSAESDLTAVSAGKTVKIRGKCAGKYGGSVKLVSCILMK